MLPQDNDVLGQALDFSAEDLTMNRAGQLSAGQRERLRKIVGRGRAASSFVILLIIACIAVVAIVALPRISAEDGGAGASLTVPIVVAALAAVAIVVILSHLRYRASQSRMLTGQVSRAEGPKTRRRRISGNPGTDYSAPSPSRIRYEVTIGGIRFIVGSRAILTAFQDGQAYCGYYVGKMSRPTLLSAEPLGSPRSGGMPPPGTWPNR